MEKHISITIDTSVLICATISGDPRYGQARRILLDGFPEGAAGSGSIHEKARAEKYISVQNLGEMFPNLTGPKMDIPDTPENARRKIEAVASLPDLTVLPLTGDVISLALELCEIYQRKRQSYFDMQIAAFMLRYRIGMILTENTKDFENIDGITPVNPFARLPGI